MLAQAKKKIEALLGVERVMADPANQFLYSRDMMTKTTLEMKAGMTPHFPDMIVWPETTKEVSRVVRIAHECHVPVIPYGGGSGVSGGTLPLSGGIIVDLKRMNRIGKIRHDPQNAEALSVVADVGVVGQNFENHLNEQGVTLGHFPSSILCATLGGYLAARSAGQLSSKYGKIEDLVEDIEVVLPTGEVISFGGTVPGLPHVRPIDLFVGSEGCLGIITQARFRLSSLPPTTVYRGLSFSTLKKGLTAVRLIMQSGLRPAVIRLYDEMDSILLSHGYKKKAGGGFKLPESFDRAFHQWIFQYPAFLQKMAVSLSSKVLLVMAFEGEKEFARAQEIEALEICKKIRFKDLGEAPGLHWLKHRYSVSFKMTKIFEQDGFVDTIEVAATWSQLDDLYKKMHRVLSQKILLLAHFSHAYHEGCSIYFTFIGRTGNVNDDRRLYAEVWHEAMETCLAAGGTISHHHGIGILKAPYMQRELGHGMDFYRRIKKTLDPRNIMNPGKMGLPG